MISILVSCIKQHFERELLHEWHNLVNNQLPLKLTTCENMRRLKIFFEIIRNHERNWIVSFDSWQVWNDPFKFHIKRSNLFCRHLVWHKQSRTLHPSVPTMPDPSYHVCPDIANDCLYRHPARTHISHVVSTMKINIFLFIWICMASMNGCDKCIGDDWYLMPDASDNALWKYLNHVVAL